MQFSFPAAAGISAPASVLNDRTAAAERNRRKLPLAGYRPRETISRLFTGQRLCRGSILRRPRVSRALVSSRNVDDEENLLYAPLAPFANAVGKK